MCAQSEQLSSSVMLALDCPLRLLSVTMAICPLLGSQQLTAYDDDTVNALCGPQMTLPGGCASVFTSPSNVQLAHDSGVDFVSDECQHIVAQT
jgi:hypothetical protein